MTHSTAKGDGEPGTGGINSQRPSVEIWWDGSSRGEDEPVTIRAENAENGDIGIAHDRNDELHVLTYPAGFQGVDRITVEDSDGVVIAAFEISVRIAA